MSKELLELWKLYMQSPDYMQRVSAINNGLSNGNIFEHFMDWLQSRGNNV